MDFNEWSQMDPDEQREHVMDSLADDGMVWMGDKLDDVLMRSIIGAMRSLTEGAMQLSDATKDLPEGQTPKVNPMVAGLWQHFYVQAVKNYKAASAMTKMKRSMGD